MNSNYDTDIDGIKKQVTTINTSLNVTNDTVKTDIPVKKLNGNRHELSQFQYRVSSINYKRNLKKNMYKKPEIINNLESMDELSQFIQENDYRKKWTKLDNFQKKKKLLEYINDLINTCVLDISFKTQLHNVLKINLENKKLKSNKIVNYDTNTLKIVSISLLTINPDRSYTFN